MMVNLRGSLSGLITWTTQAL
ncbi:unnamed protein product [Linum tenue]|uniref:Uncharacterized protein n=1 Tax=Linum tenue TaxID=586396 RepID=A0AAV0PQ46_9ROSI|nr:unnamed protein product [Linum tenue]